MKIMKKGYFILIALTLVIFIMGSVSASGIDNFTADGTDDALCSVDDDVILDSSEDDEISQSIDDDVIVDSSENSGDLLSSQNNGELLSSVDDDEDLSNGEHDDIIGDDDSNSSDDLKPKTYIEINEYDYIYDANPHSVNINDETDYVAKLYTNTEAGGSITVYIGKEYGHYTQEIAFIEDIQTLDKEVDENNSEYTTYYIRPGDLEDFIPDWYRVQVVYDLFFFNYTEVGVVRFVEDSEHVWINAPYEIVSGDWDNSYITVFVENNLGYLRVLIDNELVFEDSVDNLMYTEEDGYNHFIPIYLGDLSVGMHSYTISYYNGTWDSETFSGEIEVTFLFDVITDYDYYSDEEIDFEEGVIYYGDEIEFIFVLPDDASSNQIKVNGEVYELNLTDGIGSLKLSDFNIGENELAFTYDDPYYGEKTYTVYLTVNPKVIVPEIVSDLNRDKIEFKLPKDAQGDLKISIMNGSESIKNETITLNNGEANYSFENLPFGTYKIQLEYNDGKYNISNETSITILPHVEMSNETVMAQDASLSVDMGNVTGSIDVYIDGKKWNNESLDLPDGKLDLTIPASDLHVGENNVTLNLTGVENNPFSILNSDGELVPFQYVILVKPIEFSVPDTFADGDGNITIELPEGSSGNISVYVDGELNSTTEVSSGTNTIPLFGFGLGNYNVDVVYTDENGFNYTSSKKITVSKSIPSANILIPRDSEVPVFSIDFPTDATGFLSIHINGKDYVAELANGKAIIELPGLADGTYDVVIKYTGDNKYEGFNKRATVAIKTTPKTVPLKDPNLKINVKNIYKGKKAIVTIIANAAFSGKVIVKIKSKTYVVKVVKGKGSISISGLAVGTYKATATLTGNKVFKSSTKSTSFKVKANVYKLTLKKVKVKKSAKKLVIKATLKINGKKVKGKKLTFKFNKKTYKAKTNKKGIAKITIKKKVLKKLKVGKKVKYQVKYGKKIVKRTVKVKR